MACLVSCFQWRRNNVIFISIINLKSLKLVIIIERQQLTAQSSVRPSVCPSLCAIVSKAVVTTTIQFRFDYDSLTSFAFESKSNRSYNYCIND